MSAPGPGRAATTSIHLARGVRFDPTAGGARSLSASWARAWERDPDRPFLLEPGSRPWERKARWRTRGELEAESARRAGRLAGLGLRAGDRLLVCAQSSWELVVSYVACQRSGLVVVPTNPAYGPRELGHLVRDARPRAAIVDEPDNTVPGHAAALASLAPELPRLDPTLDLPDAPVPALDLGPPEAPALLCYTSGTTGRPKGALLSHANCLASAEALRLAWRWTERDRLLLTLPLFHMHGLGVGLHGTLHAGGSLILQPPGFDPAAVLAGIERHAASLLFGVPTMFHRLAAHSEVTALSKLRLCVSGSAPLPAALHAEIEAKTGQRVLERYGMTETLMLVSNPSDGARRPGTVGWPLPGVELRLADESGENGESGEIQVRGPNVFAGYWERPDANAEAFTADGWFRTGDLGVRDPDGALQIVGRAKELIISGGYNVHPREVEDALRGHPAIEDVAVVGEPSPEWGERVVAYAVLSEPLELTALRRFVGEDLAAYKHPRALYTVPELPRNALGKVQKHRLAGGSLVPEDRD